MQSEEQGHLSDGNQQSCKRVFRCRADHMHQVCKYRKLSGPANHRMAQASRTSGAIGPFQ